MKRYFSGSTGGVYFEGLQPLPADAVQISEETHNAIMAARAEGKVVVASVGGAPLIQDPPPPAPEVIIAILTGEVQNAMDAAARQRGYDDIRSAVTYADEPAVAKFQEEGRAFRAWRSLCWAKCYEVLAEVSQGERAVPTADELLAELPPLELPV